MTLKVQLNSVQKTATIVFAHKPDFPPFAKSWEEKVRGDNHPLRCDAVEFAHLAQMRCSTHSQMQPYAATIEEFKAHIKNNPNAEVACFACLKCDWFPDGEIIGFCHFRRTWANNIVLDYLGAHPFISAPPAAYTNIVKGVGSALIYFVIQAAKTCGSELIWGEATQNSCEYYQNNLKLGAVKDLIQIPKDKFVSFAEKFDTSWAKADVVQASAMLEEIYKIEEKNPPFIGTKNPVVLPPRIFVQHFLDLPLHQKIEVGKNLGLWEKDDETATDLEMFRRLFLRANKGGKMAGFWQEVESKAVGGRPDQNPFPT
jgi:hypothetical protein